jgi:thermitase
VRADEAWLVAKGKVTIAIVDTGVDYNHEDIKNKVSKGKDFVGGDDDPMDTHGHGTHVAGIAAAEANNNLGVAGIAWDSKILAVRGIGGSHTAMASAIKYAAKTAKIINYSGGGSDSKTKHKAVKYVVNTKKRLLVSASGNDGNRQSA